MCYMHGRCVVIILHSCLLIFKVFFALFIGHQQPQLKFLNRYVRASVGMKWDDLGIELLDSNDIGELNTIEAENSSNLNKCCTKMFNLWLNKQPTASWNQLIKALRQPCIALGTLASNIEQMLLQGMFQGLSAYKIINLCLYFLVLLD